MVDVDVSKGCEVRAEGLRMVMAAELVCLERRGAALLRKLSWRKMLALAELLAAASDLLQHRRARSDWLTTELLSVHNSCMMM